MKRYAILDYGNRVRAIEDRASCLWKKDKKPGELWAVEELAHPDMLGLYAEITAETGDAQIGMLYSDGKFVENPAAPSARLDALEAEQQSTSQAVLGLMDMLNASMI